jgi:hypothetical protein
METFKSTSLVISHASALELLHEHGMVGLGRAPRHPGSPDHVCATTGQVQDARRRCPVLASLRAPLHVLVEPGTAVHRIEGLAFHVASQTTPSRSYLRLDQGVYSAGPELCLAQVANAMHPVDLALLLMEFCGTYRVVGNGAVFEQRPLTSKTELERFAQAWRKRSSRCPAGVTRVEGVLPFVADGAASPREAALVLLLCLPFRLGGYNLPMPELNYGLDLGEGSDLDRGGRRALRFDVCWPQARFALEYDSDAFHLSGARHALDAEKRAAALQHGFSVVTVTNGQLRDPDAVADLARLVGRNIGRRVRMRRGDFDALRLDLHARLVTGVRRG